MYAHVCMYRVYVCMHACMYVCVYVYVFMYMYVCKQRYNLYSKTPTQHLSSFHVKSYIGNHLIHVYVL